MKTLEVSAYKSPKKDLLFLYIPKDSPIDTLADELLTMFGDPQHVIDFTLDENRKMPACDPQEVLKMIKQKGYYIQMPPSEIEKMGNMTPPPERLDNIC